MSRNAGGDGRSGDGSSGRAVGVRRPRNRKDQIAAAAAYLFHQDGFHNVGIDEVAAAVGITGSAVYRHFRNKHLLLAHVILHGIDLAEGVVAEATSGGRTAWPAIDHLLPGLTELILDRRDLAVLWQREIRILPEPEQAELRHRLFRIETSVCGLLRDARPELTMGDAELLAWSGLSVASSPSHHQVVLPRARFVELLCRMGTTVLAHPGAVAGRDERQDAAVADVDDGEGGAAGRGSFVARTSRREELLTTASQLFRQRGFPAVSMEDIGAAAGISGPSVYWHFSSKTDLLHAALTRGSEGQLLGMSQALVAAATPRQALEQVLVSYVDFTLGHPDLVRLLASEVVHLPEAQRQELRRAQRDYVSDWVRLLGELRPELAESEARVLVHGVLAIVNDSPRSPRLRRRAHLRDELVSLCLDVLLNA